MVQLGQTVKKVVSFAPERNINQFNSEKKTLYGKVIQREDSTPWNSHFGMGVKSAHAIRRDCNGKRTHIRAETCDCKAN